MMGAFGFFYSVKLSKSENILPWIIDFTSQGLSLDTRFRVVMMVAES